MLVVFEFKDSKRWNNLSFLDILEINSVPYFYDGQHLNIEETYMEQARRIWGHLTGINRISVTCDFPQLIFPREKEQIT